MCLKKNNVADLGMCCLNIDTRQMLISAEDALCLTHTKKTHNVINNTLNNRTIFYGFNLTSLSVQCKTAAD